MQDLSPYFAAAWAYKEDNPQLPSSYLRFYIWHSPGQISEKVDFFSGFLTGSEVRSEKLAMTQCCIVTIVTCLEF